MRKWKDRAAEDDPTAWHDVSNMWPTRRGTYETCDSASTAGATAAAGETAFGSTYAFAAAALSGTRAYVVGTKIWEYTGGALTDRTGAVTVGSAPYMTQYGDVTLCAMGVGTATVSSTGGNFAALAGAPQAEILVAQSNAVVAFNTNTAVDGWAASDVGDYTNWTTGEAASGRIIQSPGPVVAAVAFGNDIIVFKPDAIYRMTYVGGVVKWSISLLWKGLGIDYSSLSTTQSKYMAVACGTHIVFAGNYDNPLGGPVNISIYQFDGAGEPRRLNPETTITGPVSKAAFCYDPIENRFIAQMVSSGRFVFYSFDMDAWGTGDTTQTGRAVIGEHGAVMSAYGLNTSSLRPSWTPGTNTYTRKTPIAPTATSVCYLESKKIGSPDVKTTFDRLTPKLRVRRDLGSGTASLSMSLFREVEDTTATATRTITESTTRKRFDLLGGAATDGYGRFKVTWTNLDVEVEDFPVKTSSAGVD